MTWERDVLHFGVGTEDSKVQAELQKAFLDVLV